MTTAVAITTEGAFIPAAICAAVRHPLKRDLAAARREGMIVAPEVVAAVELIDNVGAWFENKRVPNVPGDVDTRHSDDPEMVDVMRATEILGISEQAITGLCRRNSLHAVKDGRSWSICRESVEARRAGQRCQH